MKILKITKMDTVRRCVSELFLPVCVILMTFPTISTAFSQFPQLDQTKMQKEIIKREILRKIDMVNRPYMKWPFQKPDRIIEKVSHKSTSTVKPPRGEYFAEIQEVISLSEQPQNSTNENIIQFRVVRDSQGRKLEVKSASLLVKVKYPLQPKVKGTKRKRNKRKKISLYLSSVKHNDKPKDVIVSIEKAKIRKTTWFKLKIPEHLIQNVLDSNQELIRLHIRCKGCKNGAKIVLVQGSKRRRKSRKKKGYRSSKTKGRRIKKRKPRRRSRNLSRTRPFLILHTKMETYLRPKRSAGSCILNETSGCCKSELVVNFAEFGWDDWILSPASFTTGVCEGSCSRRRNTHLQLEQNNASSIYYSSSSELTRTCTAKKQKPLLIIYQMDDNSIIMSNLPNMITTRCGCRL